MRDSSLIESIKGSGYEEMAVRAPVSVFQALCPIAVLLAFGRPARAQLPDSVALPGIAALSEYGRVCARPLASLWRVSLCGAIVLVDPDSRGAIANQRPPSGVFNKRGSAFVGTLPAELDIANTAFDWSAQRFTMVMLPLSDDQFDRIRLLAHESFHRIQRTLGVPAANVVIAQLEERDARYWLRLELRALSAVQLDSGTHRARTALGDALLFRAVRHREYSGIDTLEAALELSEGLAEYSGALVAGQFTGKSPWQATEWARKSLESRPTFARSYAYGAGPPLGLALDRFAPGWRGRVSAIHSLSRELAQAVHWVEPQALADSARVRALVYDGPVIAAEEDRRAELRATRLAEYRKRLIDGPVVIFRQRGLGGGFNPNTIVPLGEAGLVYPSRTVVAEWGELSVQSGGLLVANDRATAWVTAEGIHLDTSNGTATGIGWTLKLARGWTLKRGARDGDFEVAAPVSAPPVRLY